MGEYNNRAHMNVIYNIDLSSLTHDSITSCLPHTLFSPKPALEAFFPNTCISWFTYWFTYTFITTPVQGTPIHFTHAPVLAQSSIFPFLLPYPSEPACAPPFNATARRSGRARTDTACFDVSVPFSGRSEQKPRVLYSPPTSLKIIPIYDPDRR